MLHTRKLGGSIDVDGMRYDWALEREPQWSTVDGWRGMAVAVRLRGAQRQAILEFPMPSARRSKLQPQLRRPQLNRRILENGVQAALSAGWEPTSRGKAVVLKVDDSGCPWIANAPLLNSRA